MTEQNYLKTFEYLKSKKLVPLIIFLLKFSTVAVYITYPTLLAWLLYIKSSQVLGVVLVPFISFVLVTLFRNYKNAKRPYEIYGFKPLTPKNSQGKSFPSRHTFSAFVIATCALSVNAILGGVLLLLGAIIALSRVLLGLHFIKDVAFGAVIGIVLGSVIFVL